MIVTKTPSICSLTEFMFLHLWDILSVMRSETPLSHKARALSVLPVNKVLFIGLVKFLGQSRYRRNLVRISNCAVAKSNNGKF